MDFSSLICVFVPFSGEKKHREEACMLTIVPQLLKYSECVGQVNHCQAGLVLLITGCEGHAAVASLFH